MNPKWKFLPFGVWSFSKVRTNKEQSQKVNTDTKFEQKPKDNYATNEYSESRCIYSGALSRSIPKLFAVKSNIQNI